ncbi:MAG: TerB family tellurite resistance protein [Anaerolineales bacterium]|nr:TerB family tellurite resistance protein [Anaerolineales bacterium]
METEAVLTVSKVIIAAAWSDGELSPEEVESLKDLIFRFSGSFPSAVGITGRQWAELEIYMDSPVSKDERDRLLTELESTPLNDGDKNEIMAALEEMIEADGEVSAEEKEVFKEVANDLDRMHAGALGQMGRGMRGALNRRSRSVRGAPNREDYLDEYMENKIYYRLHQRVGFNDKWLAASSSDLRKLCAAGGMLARVANADHNISDAEFNVLVEALQPAGLGLSRDEAAVIAEVAVSESGKDMDFPRLIRDFFARTSPQERRSFVGVMFVIAGADGDISADEITEIESLSASLNIPRSEFHEIKGKYTGS